MSASEANVPVEIVRSQGAFHRWRGRKVILYGTYKRLPAPSFDPMRSGSPDFQPGARPFAPAQILLEQDQFRVSINSPLEKTSLRNPDELERFDGQAVAIAGAISSDQIPFVRMEQIRLRSDRYQNCSGNP